MGVGTVSPSAKLDVVGNAKVDGTTFNVDAVNNRVGINTATPTVVLDVVGSAKIDTTTFNVDAANNRVGVGTAAPSATLDVVGTVEMMGALTSYTRAEIYQSPKQATTDGFVIAWAANRGGGSTFIVGMANSSNSFTYDQSATNYLSDSRLRAFNEAPANICSITFPVRKGEFWVVESESDELTDTAIFVRFIPFGQ